MTTQKRGYENYRWFFTSSGKLVIGGKNSEQNEEIMKAVKKDDFILHTAAPGSPFCVLKNPDKKDIEETAIFTASFSQQWKKGDKKTEVHIFRGNQVKKAKNMKEGTFGISGKIEKKKVELKLALDFQKSRLRALPVSAAKKPILYLVPGSLSKETAAERIAEIIRYKIFYPVKKEEIFAAIPSDKIGILEK